MVGVGVDGSTAVGEGVPFPSTTVGEGVAVGAGVWSSIAGAIVFRAVGAGVVSVAVGAIVFSTPGAGVDTAAVGAAVSRSAGAEVNDGTVAVGAMVSRAAGAGVDREAVAPRVVGVAVPSPVDVGAAEKNKGDGDAPDMNRTGGGCIKHAEKTNLVHSIMSVILPSGTTTPWPSSCPRHRLWNEYRTCAAPHTWFRAYIRLCLSRIDTSIDACPVQD